METHTRFLCLLEVTKAQGIGWTGWPKMAQRIGSETVYWNVWKIIIWIIRWVVWGCIRKIYTCAISPWDSLHSVQWSIDLSGTWCKVGTATLVWTVWIIAKACVTEYCISDGLLDIVQAETGAFLIHNGLLSYFFLLIFLFLPHFQCWHTQASTLEDFKLCVENVYLHTESWGGGAVRNTNKQRFSGCQGRCECFSSLSSPNWSHEVQRSQVPPNSI